MTSESIDPARAAVNQRPPEMLGDTIWRDTAYVGVLIGRYIRSDPLVAGLLVVVIMGSSLLASVLVVNLNVKLGAMTDALVALNAVRVRELLLSVLLILVAALVLGQALLAASYVVRWRWRSKYTVEFIERWMSEDRFLSLQRDRRVENPEQRIQEDLYFVAQSLTDLLPSLLATLVSVTLSMQVIWRVSHPLSLAAIGIPITVPADMLVATLVFAAIWTVGAHFVGRPITSIEVARQRLEADFRHDLGQVREHGEAIAFERGANRERAGALQLFGLLGINWRKFTVAQVQLSVFNEFISLLVPRFVPVLLSIPHILAGQMTVGQMAAAAISFTLVLSGLAVIARLYASIAALRAGVARIRLLDTELHRPRASDIHLVHGADGVTLRDVSIDLPGGERLLDVGRFEVRAGDRILVRGRSGAGKSTLLRAIAGLWPYGAGRIDVPARERVMFLPQRGYMPSGTLAELLCYPRAPSEAERGRYVDALRRLSLTGLVNRLDDYAEWRRVLSPGEQQRVAAVRAMLHAPDFLFLDEATSALDIELEADLYRVLTEALPTAAIVSVAHRPTVARFHSTAVDIAAGHVETSVITS
jgi:putative ATP-binding cassette transporter